MPLVQGPNSIIIIQQAGLGSSCATPAFDQNKTSFAGMTLDQVRSYFTQLQKAYLDLSLGNKVVTVSYEGKSVTYTQADAGRLMNLRDEAAQILGYGRQRRALRPIYR